MHPTPVRASKAQSLPIAFFLAACAVAGAPALIAQTHPTSTDASTLSFEVAAIKPSKPNDPHTSLDTSYGRLQIEHMSLRRLIQFAYELSSRNQVIGGPKWIDQQYFDIVAKESDEDLQRRKGLPDAERKNEFEMMMQSLLADRFSLQATKANRKLPAFALLQAKSGAKLQPEPAGGKGWHISSRGGELQAKHTSMAAFADFLSRQREFGTGEVIDKTKLPGTYDFKLHWSPQYRLTASADYTTKASLSDDAPDLITALKEQLGLVVKRSKEQVPVVIVQSVSEPSPN